MMRQIPDDRDSRADRSEDRTSRDRELGLFRPITRRDLLQGVGLVVAGSMAAPLVALSKEGVFAPERDVDYYPQGRTGMRGDHPGSYEVAHRRAWRGKEWRSPTDVDEGYDLIVVGAGISGLAAAHFYRAAHKDARILILDNHEDFGGCATRNEFQHGGERYLANGGSVYLSEYGSYSDVTRGLLSEIGVDLERLGESQDSNFLNQPFGLENGVYFDSAHFGRDQLMTGLLLPFTRTGPDGEYVWVERVGELPISAAAQGQLKRFLSQRTDYLADVPDAEKMQVLNKISYHDFLVKRAGLPEEAVRIFQRFTAPIFGVGIDAVPALSGLGFGMPGLRGLGDFGRAMELEQAKYAEEMQGVYFPDGNSTVPRLQVRKLIPGVGPGENMEEVVTARFDYARLDAAGSPVRLRLNSTAVHVDSSDGGVAVTYVRGGRAYRARARECVLACYFEMIPYLCPQLPEAQKEALKYPEKVPMVSTNVLLQNGKALEKVGSARFYSPGRFHTAAFGYGGSLGKHQQDWDPKKPTVLHMIASPGSEIASGSARERYREGRERLVAMTFTDYEREVREHLAGMLAGGGFDPARDILALTVNRWPHGYTYERDPLSDPEWPEGQAPHEIGRQRFGRIAIASADAAGSSYINDAIDQAHRAVGELVKSSSS
jgi:spermidine dehydrogenase